ncbi:hypothetical protein [Paenibacillus paeoniae]|uniref:hypothetical protein n=1 Tax=Paenibacillus paeoniae TaxID=2292705 RepID=UPI00197EF089|nr:hypothetical protein [Paenibacillus paeoniae]
MSSTKALVRGQKQLLGVVRGMMGSMNLAALAVDGMQRSMIVAERKAAERMQSSMSAMERAVTAIVTPLDEAAKGIAALAEAIDAAGKRMISVSQPIASAGISTAIQLPSFVPAEPPAQETKAVSLESERAKLEEKIKKEVIPKFGEFIGIIGSNIPDIKSITEDEKKKTEEKKKQETEMAASKQMEAILSSQGAIFEEMSTKLTGLAALQMSFGTQLKEWLDSMHKTIQSGFNAANDSLSGILAKISSIVSFITQFSSGRGSGTMEALPYGGSSNLLPVPYKEPENSVVLANKATSGLQTANAMSAMDVIEHSPSNTLALPAPAVEGAAAGADQAVEATAAEEKKKKLDALPGVAESVSVLKNNLTALMSENAAVVGFMADNWSAFGSVFDGVNKAVNIYNTLQMISQSYMAISAIAMRVLTVATTGLKTAWNGMNTAMKANVIILIISLVAGLVTAIVGLWKTNDSFAMFFYRIWNGVLNFIDQIPVIINETILAVMLVFQKLASFFSDFFETLFGFFKKVANFVLDLLGIKVDIPESLTFDTVVNHAVETQRAKVNNAKEKAAQNATDRENKLQQFFSDRENERNKEKMAEEKIAEEKAANAYEDPGTQFQQDAIVTVGGGRLDEVGKINDTVDISSEDLKTMRELAELKNIQNFVTLQPSVNVQTGDIRNGMDVSSMVQAITTVLQEEIAVSAEGVYR